MSEEKEPVILDFFEGYIVQAIEDVRKEKDGKPTIAIIKYLENGLNNIIRHRGVEVAKDVITKYNLDKLFGITLAKKSPVDNQI